MKKAVILGCGGSSGVPGIGNYWGKCDPSEPKNIRQRTSLALMDGEAAVLIDTGPDIVSQYNAMNIKRLDAVIYTHGHADHINGADELRWVFEKTKKPIKVYSSIETVDELKKRFYYLFEPPRPDMYSKIFDVTAWNKNDFYKSHKVSNFAFDLIPLDHETVTSCGFRFGDALAYTTDVVRIDKKSLESIAGVDTWVVDAGAYHVQENKAHASIEDVIEWNEIVKARQVYFTAMPPSMDYQTVLNETPEGYAPAYDGLEIPLEL